MCITPYFTAVTEISLQFLDQIRLAILHVEFVFIHFQVTALSPFIWGGGGRVVLAWITARGIAKMAAKREELPARTLVLHSTPTF